jgi:hypothetical protein
VYWHLYLFGLVLGVCKRQNILLHLLASVSVFFLFLCICNGFWTFGMNWRKKNVNRFSRLFCDHFWKVPLPQPSLRSACELVVAHFSNSTSSPECHWSSVSELRRKYPGRQNPLFKISLSMCKCSPSQKGDARMNRDQGMHDRDSFLLWCSDIRPHQQRLCPHVM